MYYNRICFESLSLMKHASLLLLLHATCLFSLPAWAEKGRDGFIENRNQWPAQVKYAADFKGGRVFLEQRSFTVVLLNTEQGEAVHESIHQAKNPADMVHPGGHAYRMSFEGARADAGLVPKGKLKKYHNYFVGNKPSQWASKVALFEEVAYTGLYAGVDLLAHQQNGAFKYDLFLAPNADLQQVRMRYTGVNNLSISEDGHLLIPTSVGTITEQIPEAYQLIGGKKVNVKCRYVLRENVVGFVCSDAYNKSYPLVIDPVLVAATYSGSISTTMGWLSTSDKQGNIYTTGVSFGPGYPTTLGSYLSNYPGYYVMVISKISPSGSDFLYATFLGGSIPFDFPRNSKVDKDGNLVVVGVTTSADFPVTPGCYDNSLDTIGTIDYFIAKMNPSGSTLLASSYLGGSNGEGFNEIQAPYGFANERGELEFDAAGNIFFAGCTGSTDFPVTAGAYDPTFNGGGQDGILVKLSSDLSTLLYSTFIGGSGADGCYGMRRNSGGDVFLCGATRSTDFPSTPGAYHSTFQGDSLDGFILKLSNNASTLSASTFVGTNGIDQVYFLDLDASGNPVILGQTSAPEAISPGCYGVPGSNLFISRYNSGLTQREFYTVYGNGIDTNIFIPTGFMLDVCGNIFSMGWSRDGTNFPLTPNALQDTTDGRDFHMLVLSTNASSLLYGSYFGALLAPGEGYGDHNDGGNCFFDKAGLVMQVICQDASNMTTTPGAISTVKNSFSYDIALFKMDFQTTVHAEILVDPSGPVCTGLGVNFSNTSSAPQKRWNFGDGSPIDTTSNPQHVFAAAGTYLVTLVVTDPSKCNVADTATVSVVVVGGSISTNFLGPDTVLCGTAQSITLNAGPASSWLWSNGTTSQTLVTTNPGTYFVVKDASTPCPSRDTVVIALAAPPNLGADTTICAGTSLTLNAGAADSFQWSTGQTSQSISVNAAGTYAVTVTRLGCVLSDSASVALAPIPVVNLGNDVALCPGSSLVLDAGNPGGTYLWSNTQITRTILVSASGVYYVRVSNGVCSKTDTITITNAVAPVVNLGPDPSLCAGANLILDAGNAGSTFLWSTAQTSQTISVGLAGIYSVRVDNGTCQDTDSILVSLLTAPAVNLGNDTVVSAPFILTLDAGPGGQWLWNTGDATQTIQVSVADTYFVRVGSVGGCNASDTIVVKILEEPTAVSCPNVFTPNGDKVNDWVRISVNNVKDFSIDIFDRWGNNIKQTQFTGIASTERYLDVWDGTRQSSSMVDDGVYYFVYRAIGYDGKEYGSSGFIQLLQHQ